MNTATAIRLQESALNPAQAVVNQRHAAGDPILFELQRGQTLRIVDLDHIAADRMVGSWAGAMGHTQFMPSVFLAHAVDADGDGQRDIWGSIPDVAASTVRKLPKFWP